uniref:Uncharacterized protein n=1 Tax=Opuntia streptacantha TaxID=393608 RepID=A0A7C9DNB7_OPUST
MICLVLTFYAPGHTARDKFPYWHKFRSQTSIPHYFDMTDVLHTKHIPRHKWKIVEENLKNFKFRFEKKPKTYPTHKNRLSRRRNENTCIIQKLPSCHQTRLSNKCPQEISTSSRTPADIS